MKRWLIFFTLSCIMAIFVMHQWIIPEFVFYPTRKAYVSTPQSIGLKYENVRLHTADGETLAAWYVPAKSSGQVKEFTVLFFHGNAGNISHWVRTIGFFNRLGVSLFVPEYRGFGESTGSPSINGTIQDAHAAWQWLTEHKKIPASQIIILGRSLGGGVAAALAKDVTPGALVLESTFTSLSDMAQAMIPWFPKFVFLADYATVKNIRNLAVPLLVVHSRRDEVVDFRMGREIFESYNGPKSFLELRGSHNGGWMTDDYEKAMREFLRKLRDGSH